MSVAILTKWISRYQLLACSFWVPLLMAGCQSKKMPLNNPYYNGVFAGVDSLDDLQSIKLLDSLKHFAFGKHPPGANDMVDYYYSRINALQYNYTSILLVTDSLEFFMREHHYITDHNLRYAKMLIAKVEAYTYAHQYETAMNYLAKAKLFIEENLHHTCTACEFKMALAQALSTQARFQLSAASYVEVAQCGASCDSGSFDHFYNRYAGLYNAGFNYNLAGIYDSASHYFDSALLWIDQNAPHFPDRKSYFKLCKALVSRNYGRTLTTIREFHKAEELILFSINTTAAEYPLFSAQGSMMLAELYVESDQLDKAKRALEAEDEIDTPAEGNLKYWYEINSIKKKYYQKRGDLAKALHYNDLAIAKHDTLDFRSRRDVDRDLAMELGNIEQTEINTQLKLQNQRTNFQLQLAILSGILVLLVAAFTWSSLRRSSKYAKKQRQLNKEIQRKNEDILDAYHSLENSYADNQSLMRTVAHDLKNPIAAIGSMIRYMLKTVRASGKLEGENAEEMMVLINDACTGAVTLINDMVMSDAAKMQNKTKEMNDLWRLLEYCVDLMKPRAEEKKQQLVLEGEHAEAMINKDQMWRVIVNILNNAIKFSPEGNSIHVTLEKVETSVVLAIKDDGIGIPEHLLEKIFESSSDAQRTGTSGEQSYGLGLGISRQIIKEHNGKLWVESQEGKGSTFFVMLPSHNPN